MRISLVLFYLALCGLVHSQCDLDRHNTTLSAGWISCDISPSPNPIRGDSHWIQYDLGEAKRLGSSHFWNMSNPLGLDSGARQIAISISLDGISWEELAIYEAPIGDSSGFYKGVQGYDFGGITARFVLLTVLNNHGSNSGCVGFSEIRVQIEQSTSTTDIVTQAPAFSIYPNPANNQVSIANIDLPTGEYLMQILDLSGKTVLEKNIKMTEAPLEVSTESIISGQYFLSLKNGNLVKQSKLIIIKE